MRTLEATMEAKGSLRAGDWTFNLDRPLTRPRVMRKRVCQEWPLLSIVVKNRKRRHGKKPLQIRMIKVRMDGPISGRWVNYAHWWWEQNRGPVPEGKRVVHIDGNSLNDDQKNLELMTPGDVAFLCHDRDPKMSEKNFAKLSKATAERNRMAGEINRAREWLPTYWYAVDLGHRIVINQPRRQLWQVYADLGLEISAETARHHISIALGFPEVSGLMACALGVLAASPWPMTRLQLQDKIGDLRELRGWPAGRPTVGALAQAKTAAPEWIEVSRRGARAGLWSINDEKLARRKAWTRYVVMRGAALTDPQYVDFQRAVG